MAAHRSKQLLVGATLALGLLGTPARVSATDAAEPGWPATIVKLEELQPLTDYVLRAPGGVNKGRVTGPAILRVHVTAEGHVARMGLLESSGNASLDEASMHAMRDMRFKPYTFGGVPQEVTLLVPVHVPARLGRTR